jgi:hypothetical protein
MTDQTKTPTNSNNDSDFAWHAEGIGAVINKPPSQVYYLYEQGLLGDAVVKLGPKTLLGSKSRLRNLFFPNK